MRRKYSSQTKLYKKLVHERVTEIRRKGRLAKYKPKLSPTKIESIQYNKRNGRPASFLPMPRESEAFNRIQKYFIEPLIRSPHWSEEITLKERLEIIFNVNSRDIVPAICREDIKMPGKVLDTDRASKYREPINKENIFAKGTPIFVRIDDNMPDRIDVENCETEDLMFSLTRAEYKTILYKIEELDGCDYRLDPPGEVRNEDGSFSDLT